MTTMQAILLGVMIALTPSLIFLCLALRQAQMIRDRGDDE